MTRRPSKPEPEAIYAFDPGVTTGLALFQDNHVALSQLNLSEMEAIPELFAKYPPKVVIIEDFQVNPAHSWGGRASADTWAAPVRLAAQIEVYARPYSPKLVYQPPSDKSTFTDARIKAIYPQYYSFTRGQPHARDALRHLALYCRRHSIRLS